MGNEFDLAAFCETEILVQVETTENNDDDNDDNYDDYEIMMMSRWRDTDWASCRPCWRRSS